MQKPTKFMVCCIAVISTEAYVFIYPAVRLANNYSITVSTVNFVNSMFFKMDFVLGASHKCR